MDVQIKAGFLLAFLHGILSGTGASSICETNREARSLIGGNNINVVNHFLRVLRNTNTFSFEGDNQRHENSCRRSMQSYLHRKGHADDDGITWILDCWEPVECVLVDGEIHNMFTIRAEPIGRFPYFDRRPKAVLLPIDQHNSISYTFLPYVQQTSGLFVTSLLSGCSVFVATADNINCNIIVMHANRYCNRNEPDDDDDNHRQAMFVLESVNAMNRQCRYQIQRRWASEHRQENIARHNYHYSVVFYRISAVNFVYGNNLGGCNRRWQFCLKELARSPLPEICYHV